MDSFNSLMHGFEILLTWQNMFLMLLGLVLGVFVGVLPGLGAPNGVAILLPMTFTLDPTSAIVMLSCLYWGSLFGGAITSILFNIPGEAASVATTFDGYPMAKSGRAGEALTAAFTGSFLGALAAVTLITFLAPVVADFALRFGPPEFFAVYLLTFCSFIGMARGAVIKVGIVIVAGFLISCIGMDTVSGELRMTFGNENLLSGIDFLVVVIGLFGLGEIFITIEERVVFGARSARITPAVIWATWKQMPSKFVSILRSCFVGCWMGVTPGGSLAGAFMSYGLAKRFSPQGNNFGKGEMEGVLAPETGAHAAGTSALLPMLALGIPGSGTAAVLLGRLLIWGLQPGPLLFVEQRDFVWGLIASMYLGNVVGFILVLMAVPFFAMVLRLPFSAIAPIIVVICAIGAFTVNNSPFDMVVMLLFGFVGYVFKKLNYPLAPFVLALILGRRTEDAFRQSIIGSGGDLGVFFQSWLATILMALALLLLLSPILSQLFGRAAGRLRRA